MRNAGRLLLLGLVLLWTGCSHQVTEKDMVGTWNPDPASAKNASADAAKAFSRSKLTLTEDKKYVLDFMSFLQIKGKWDFNAMHVRLNPEMLVLNHPRLPGGKLEMTPQQFIEQAKPMLSQMPGGAEQSAALDAVGNAIDLKVSEDGKTVTSSDGAAWKKPEGK